TTTRISMLGPPGYPIRLPRVTGTVLGHAWSMRVHSINCVTMCPPGRRLMDGRKGAHGQAILSCHCLLVEAGDRLILCDTGFGLEDVRHPNERLDPIFRGLLCRPRLREEDTAVRQIARLGF